MGFWKDIGGSLLSAGSSLLGSAFGLAGQNKSNKANIGMQREQNAWNAEQAKLQRDWQSAESSKSRDWQEEMWRKNNEYNTPQAQMQRMQQAGLNPWLMSGDAGVASTAPQGAAASGGSSAQGVAPPYQSGTQYAESFNMIASALSSLAQAKKTGVDTSFLERTLNDRVMSESLKRDLLEIQRDWSGRLNERQVAKLSAEIADAWDRMDLRNNEKLTEAERAEMIHQQRLEIMENIKIKGKQYEELSRYVDNYLDKWWKARIAKEKADANASNASANASNASAQESRSRTELNKLDFRKQNEMVKYKTLSGQVLTIPYWKSELYKNALDNSSASETYKTRIKQLQADAAAAQARGDYATAQEILNLVDQGIGTILKVRVATESPSDELSSEETVKSDDGRHTIKTKHKTNVPRRRLRKR